MRYSRGPYSTLRYLVSTLEYMFHVFSNAGEFSGFTVHYRRHPPRTHGVPVVPGLSTEGREKVRNMKMEYADIPHPCHAVSNQA